MFAEVTFPGDLAMPATEVAPADRPPAMGRHPSYSLTKHDLQLLTILMRKLAGYWVCNVVTDEGGDVRACISRPGEWDPYRREYLVAREGSLLCLMATRIPYSPRVLGVYESIADVADALGGVIGSRLPAIVSLAV